MPRALYRKYRSQSLEEVIGQSHITRTLALALKSGKLSHAYLFTGPRGVGKTSVARILAHAINGLPYPPDKPHLDIIEIDAASNRRIDDVRDLREKVRIAPAKAKYKVYIIDEVHMLTNESFNALLKTLEEPPAHAVFILATTEAHKLPATILSRVQRFHFRLIAKTDLLAHLKVVAEKEKIRATEPALELIAGRSDGSARDALSLLDQLASLSGDSFDEAFVEDVLGLAPGSDVAGLLELFHQGDRQGLYRQLLDLEQRGVSPTVLGGQLAEALQPAAIQDPTLYDLIEQLIATPKALMPFLHLSAAMLKHAKAAPDQPTSGLKGEPKTVAAAAAIGGAELVADAHAPSGNQMERPTAASKTKKPAADGNRLQNNDWPKVLQAVKAINQPLYAILNQAEAEIDGGPLRLTFAYKLHQKKLDDQRYRKIIAATIKDLGFACPEIIGEWRTPKAARRGTAGSPVDSVIALMGGQEVTDA